VFYFGYGISVSSNWGDEARAKIKAMSEEVKKDSEVGPIYKIVYQYYHGPHRHVEARRSFVIAFVFCAASYWAQFNLAIFSSINR